MKEWNDEEAVLTVDAGTGWLSRYEFGELKAGSVIRSTTEAGTGCVISLNGDFFAHGSISVLGNRLCARIESHEESETEAVSPCRGDRATEMLRFAIRSGRACVPMSALEGTGVGSIINLDRLESADSDAELVIAGKAVARGKVTVIGENMGLRITEMLIKAPHDSFPRTTGSALAPGYAAEKVKDYNFYMPDRFTKRAIVRTQDIHLDFIRGWQSRFPELTGWKLSYVDQLNYGEWIDDRSRSDALFVSFRPAQRAREYKRENGGTVPDTLVVESPNVRQPVSDAEKSDIASWIVERLEKRESLPFRISVDSSTAELLCRDENSDITLACLRNSWLAVADLRIGRASGAEEAVITRELPVAPERERWSMILVARLESESGGKIDIVYPEDLIDPYLPALGR